METTMQIIAAVLAVPLAALGLRSLLLPAQMAAAVGLSPVGVPGLGEVRSVLGGLLAGSAALIAVGVFTTEPVWFLAVAVLMGVAIVGRLISLAVDGVERSVVPPLVIEIVVAAVMVATAIAID
ncbi:MAG: hypothetical protein AAF945_17405 [Actinomycetota bacterium]